MPRILLDKISKSYDGGQSIAVKELDLQIEDGEFMCLLGPAGCGKTTTLRMIAGLENLTKGEIIVGDRVVVLPQPDGPSKHMNSPSSI
jgi:iron(III) transport system ATP-binding protein